MIKTPFLNFLFSPRQRLPHMSYQCFYINCAKEIPAATWEASLSSQLTDTELKYVQGYVFRKDQERSLLSLLLQKYVIRSYLSTVPASSSAAQQQGHSHLAPPLLSSCLAEEKQFRIARTRENKPYLVVTSPDLQSLEARLGNTFNYNVSHHGNYVGIVSHTNLLVGMDIVDVTTRASWVNSLKEYVDIYYKQLSDLEIDSILSCASEEKCYTHFYVIWSLKEAYVKAIGVGIGINLKEVEFDVVYNDPAAPNTSTAPTSLTATSASTTRLPPNVDFYEKEGFVRGM
jgi:phosphopantetheine--protein transferase-like protein